MLLTHLNCAMYEVTPLDGGGSRFFRSENDAIKFAGTLRKRDGVRCAVKECVLHSLDVLGVLNKEYGALAFDSRLIRVVE